MKARKARKAMKVTKGTAGGAFRMFCGYGVLLGLALTTITCSSKSATPSDVSSVGINGLSTYSRIGIKAQYQALVTQPDGRVADVTQFAQWASSNPSQLTMSKTGLTELVAGGLNTIAITATYQGMVGELDVTITVGPTDCGAYDPASLGITQALNPPLWSVVGGNEIFFALESQADANDTVTLMKSYNTLCFVGRNNQRPNHKDFIVNYWQPAGPAPALAITDCQPYNPAALTTLDAGAAGWEITDGTVIVAFLDTQADANTLLSVIRQNSSRCYVGRAHSSNPSNSVVTYWK